MSMKIEKPVAVSGSNSVHETARSLLKSPVAPFGILYD